MGLPGLLGDHLLPPDQLPGAAAPALPHHLLQPFQPRLQGLLSLVMPTAGGLLLLRYNVLLVGQLKHLVAVVLRVQLLNKLAHPVLLPLALPSNILFLTQAKSQRARPTCPTCSLASSIQEPSSNFFSRFSPHAHTTVDDSPVIVEVKSYLILRIVEEDKVKELGLINIQLLVARRPADFLMNLTAKF